jgi:hypothetical protein
LFERELRKIDFEPNPDDSKQIENVCLQNDGLWAQNLSDKHG